MPTRSLLMIAAISGGCLGVLIPAAACRAQAAPQMVSSGELSLAQTPESIYAPPTPPREDQGVNEGAVHIDLTIRYMTDYIYRGIDFSEVAGSEDAPNVQVDTKINFDLGKLPHPYVGVFVNYYDSDPISQFQEIRPSFGFDWPIKPLVFSAGYNSYIYPDRDELSTSEVYGKIQLDDSSLWGARTPILSPYAYGAYDFDIYNGWYFEAGVTHDFVLEDTGLTFTLLADAAYIMSDQQFQVSGTNDTGFQHYDLGAIMTYSLNALLNVSKRYGEFSLQGYLYYTDNLDSDLRADTQLWGGAGINFKY